MKKVKLMILLVMIINISSLGQIITDPVENPYFIIKRESPFVVLPKELGGKSVKGYAGITITLDKSGKLLSTELKKLKLSGKVNLSYQSGYDKKNMIVDKYEAFVNECVSKIKIIKTDNRTPPDTNKLTFIIRF